jgi:hypothetical protein
MPTVVNQSPILTNGRPPKYDWSTIFDGRTHHFPLDELPSTPRNFARGVRAAAVARRIQVRIVTRKAQGVYVQRVAD